MAVVQCDFYNNDQKKKSCSGSVSEVSAGEALVGGQECCNAWRNGQVEQHVGITSGEGAAGGEQPSPQIQPGESKWEQNAN